MELEDLEKYSKPYNLNEENSSNSNLEEIYELYNKYLKSRTSKSLHKLIDVIINNVTPETAHELLNLKLTDETVIEVILKLEKVYYISQVMFEYICQHDELIIKALNSEYEDMFRHAPEEVMFRDINGMTIFEHFVSNNVYSIVYQMGMYKNNKDKMLEITKKYNHEDYLQFLSEDLLFEKYDDNKLIIEYLLEKGMIEFDQIYRIINHPEIIDYIEKYDSLYLLPFLNKEILLTKKDNKLMLEYLLEKGVTPRIDRISDRESVDLLLKYEKYETLRGITIRQAFVKVPGTDMELFEYLITKGIVSKNVVDEIKKNNKYSQTILSILKKHHLLNYLCDYPEEKMLLEYGQGETLLESLLKDSQLIYMYKYIEKESFDLLVKYGRYEELAACDESLLLEVLPNGKKLYEELIERKIKFKFPVTNPEIIKKLIETEDIDMLSVDSSALLKPMNLNETYFDKVLEIIKKQNRKDVIERMGVDSLNLEETATVYISLIEHGLYEYLLKPPTLNDLLKEKNGKTLLEVLLEKNKKITQNNILTYDMRANIDVAIILKLHGIKQDYIEYDNILGNLSEEYTKKVNEELNNMPITIEQEELLAELFSVMNDGKSDMDCLNVMIASYRNLLSTRNPYSYEIYQLISLKMKYPEFSIKLGNDAKYSGSEKTIYLENLSVDTFNHEMGHALHGMLCNDGIPEGFEELLQAHRKSLVTHAKATVFAHRHLSTKKMVKKYVDSVVMREYEKRITEEDKKKIQEYLDTLKTEQKEKYLERGYSSELLDTIFSRTFTVEDYIIRNKTIQRNEIVDIITRTEYPEFTGIGDYLDGIFEGKLYAGKMRDVLRLTRLPNTYGHGEDYYKDDTQAVFNEMMANYSKIVKSKKPQENLKMLKFYIGEELFNMVSEFYIKNINNNYTFTETQTKTL